MYSLVWGRKLLLARGLIGLGGHGSSITRSSVYTNGRPNDKQEIRRMVSSAILRWGDLAAVIRVPPSRPWRINARVGNSYSPKKFMAWYVGLG
jgi:hypothetical protein